MAAKKKRSKVPVGTKVPAKSSPTWVVPLTERQRQNVDELSFCVNAELDDDMAKELREACGLKVSEHSYAATPQSDAEAAIQVQWLGEDRQIVHFTLEYRSGLQSPYPRKPVASIRRVLRLLGNAKRLTLVHAECTTSAELNLFSGQRPLKFSKLGSVRMKAIEFATDSAADGESMTVRVTDNSIRVKAKFERAVESLEDAANVTVGLGRKLA